MADDQLFQEPLDSGLDINKYLDLLDQASPVEVRGRVSKLPAWS
jgi:hypothetical protein